MQQKSQQKSKAVLILMTVLVLIGAIGFFYPFLTKSPTYIPPQPTTGGDTNGPHLPTSPEIPVDRAPLISKITNFFKPGLPVYYGITTHDLMDSGKVTDAQAVNEVVALGGENETSRAFGTKNFTASGVGYYVYFAWPTTYEDNGVFSCKSITLFGDPRGKVDCFASGTSDSVLFNTTDMIHRTLPAIVGPDGVSRSYEVYRAHFFISSGGTVYYSPH